MPVAIRDPIYGIIEIEDDILPLINNPYFQRLRNVKQVGALSHVYPSAKHDRFSHSLGAYHLMKKVVANSYNDHLSSQDKFALKVAALLHDVGHGPYSHLWEEIAVGFDHEEMSIRIISEVFKQPLAASIVAKKHPMYPLLSSVLDVDKLDYMIRDSYFCGVGYGVGDIDRIVTQLHVKDERVCITPKVVPSAEHIIMGRISLYKSTYFHHTVRCIDAILKKIFLRVRDLLKEGKDVFVDSMFRSCFEGKVLLEDFAYFDDSIVEFHLTKWRKAKDPILLDLVTRYFNRNGFLSLSMYLTAVSDDEIKEVIAKKFDLRYYVFEDAIKKSVYEAEALVAMPNGKITPFSEVSSYVKSIKDIPIVDNLLIGPKEVLSEFKKNAKQLTLK